MLGRIRLLVAGSLVAATVVLPTTGGTAFAQTASGTFVYTGQATDTAVLLDTGLVYEDGCGIALVFTDDPVLCAPDGFPGTIWFRLQVGIEFVMDTSHTAEFELQAPNSFRQDTTAPLSTTLTRIDAAGNEVKVRATPYLEVDVAYDSPLANCPKSTITTLTELDNASTSGTCLNAVLHDTLDFGTYDLFAKSLLLPYTGATSATDTKQGPELDIGALIGLAGLLKVRLDADLTATMTAGAGYTANRVLASTGGPSLASSTIGWPSASPQADNVTVPCAAPVGDNLVYSLDQNTWQGHSALTILPKLVLSTIADIELASFALGSPTSIFSADITAAAAPDFTAVLGDVQAENKPPVIGVITAPAGVEGTPIQFGVIATDNCGTPSIRWNFSDGTVEYGPSPLKAFADGGATYSGQVTATDGAGNTAIKTFSVSVANVDPTVSAGPDKAQLWGLPVSFTANGSDAGSIDRASLLYSWDFGDPASPIGASGHQASHVYGTPGSYTAMVTVLDKDGGSGSDTVGVTVQKRATVSTYTGATSGQLTDTVTMSATVADQLGAPVPGRVVTFLADGGAVGAATTNSAGVANMPYLLSGLSGVRQMTAEIATDGLYLATASAPVALTVAKETAVITYTSVLTSSPSKAVPLSAKLTDDDGVALAAKTLVFSLGSQGCSATTNAAGVASCSIPKLTQKPGKYPFGISFAGDATYTSATYTATFVINK